jgi:hypothetical protein
MDTLGFGCVAPCLGAPFPYPPPPPPQPPPPLHPHTLGAHPWPLELDLPSPSLSSLAPTPSIADREVKYYADGEDAYCMKKALSREVVGLSPVPEALPGTHNPPYPPPQPHLSLSSFVTVPAFSLPAPSFFFSVPLRASPMLPGVDSRPLTLSRAPSPHTNFC